MKRTHFSALACFAVALAGTTLLSQQSMAETLKVGIAAPEIKSLDPIRASATEEMAVVSSIYNGLVRFKPGSSAPADIEADLAESWDTSDDGLTWTFHLRGGVQFQAGFGTLTADDVVFSLLRASDPEKSSFASDYKAFKSVKAVDSKTVEIVLSSPVPGFLGLLANYHGGNIVSEKAVEKYGEDFKNHPVGTGPFAFKSSVTQQDVQLTAFADYFRGAPKLDGIEYDLIPNDSSRELAFHSGELDLIYGKREQRWVELAKGWDNAKVDVFSPGEFRTLFLNMTHKPLDNLEVRQAIAKAVDVSQIVQFAGASVAQKGCSVVPNGYMGEDCSWTYSYDPEGAKELLAKAGYADGLTLSVISSSSSAQLPIMQIIQAQLSKVGIVLDLKVVDHPTYHQQIRQDLSDLVFYGAARFPVADSYLTQFYHSDSAIGKPTAVTNFAHCDAGDADISAARKATSDEDRMKYWSAAQQKIHEQVCSVPLFSLLQVWVQNTGLDLGYKLTGSMNLAPLITEKTTITR